MMAWRSDCMKLLPRSVEGRSDRHRTSGEGGAGLGGLVALGVPESLAVVRDSLRGLAQLIDGAIGGVALGDVAGISGRARSPA